MRIKTTQFKTKPEGFQEVKKEIIKRTIPFGIIAAGVGLAINIFNPNSTAAEAPFYLSMIPFFILIIGFGLYRGIKRQKEIFESYLLTIDDNSITREAHNTPTITIAHNDVQSITKYPNGGFVIKGKNTANIIGVSQHIENYELLESLLQKIQPISSEITKTLIEKYQLLFIFTSIGSMMGVFISMNKMIVGICGILFLTIFTYSILETRKSKNIDKKTKRGLWVSVFVLLSVIGNMYFKLWVN